MSHPIEDFELSALIDGELDPDRAAEVRLALAQDPALCGQYESLAEADRIWATSAESARFVPALRRDAAAASPWRAQWSVVAALALMLAAGRLALKFLSIQLAAGTLLQAVMLVAAIAVVVWIGGRTTADAAGRQ